MRYFTSPEDLALWVLSNKNANDAISKIADVIGIADLSIKEGCSAIFNNNLQKERVKDKDGLDKDTKVAAKALYTALSEYGLTEIQKQGEVKMSNKKSDLKKEAQYRQPGPAIVYNRETDNNYNLTPWRRDRDEMYGFIHRNPDMISFSEDPNMVYSGEALWRAYIMDKFTRDYKDESGRVVGGYINDRFQVFHDVAGNQMELANGERTRKPRPHQYSTERRLEEARGEKCKDIEPLASSNDMVKLAAKDAVSSEDKKGINIFEMFKDVVDMKQAGLKDEDIICKIAEHYERNVIDVAAIHKLATRQTTAHQNIIYAASTEDLKKKVEATAKISIKPLVAVGDEGSPLQIVPVYNQNGVFSAGSSNATAPLTRPIAVFPVEGADINTVPVYASQQIPNVLGTQYPPTMFFTLQDIGAVEESILDQYQFEDMLRASSETGLIDEDQTKIDQVMKTLQESFNPLDQAAKNVVDKANIQETGIEGAEAVTNLAEQSIEAVDNPTKATRNNAFRIIEV